MASLYLKQFGLAPIPESKFCYLYLPTKIDAASLNINLFEFPVIHVGFDVKLLDRLIYECLELIIKHLDNTS